MAGQWLGRRGLLLSALAAPIWGAARAAAEVRLAVAGGVCRVGVSLDGRQARLILDTGAEISLLSQAAVRRLGLLPDPWVSTNVRGAGGLVERRANVDVRVAQAGGVRLIQHPPARAVSFPVTSSGLGGADGLLGGDILRNFALALDMPGQRAVLLPPRALPRAPGGVALQILGQSLLLAPVSLDGHELTALVDTGASASLVTARGLYRLGLTRADMAAGRDVTIWTVGGAVDARTHQFTALRLGALEVARPVLFLQDVPSAAFDIVLGLDILGRRPFLLSYANASLSFG